jgi:hypothetical protein
MRCNRFCIPQFSHQFQQDEYTPYCHVLEALYTEFGMVIGLVERLQTVITSNYNAIANSHTLHCTTARNKCSHSMGLERGPLSLVNNLRSYLEQIVAAPGLENQSYDRRDSLRWPHDNLYPLKLALASLTGGDRSIGIVR